MNWRDTLNEHFSGAMDWPELVHRANRYMHGLEMSPDNTLFGNVVCRDEINQSGVKAFGDYWGQNFDLAGLAGYPTAGVTGFTAYHHHVPDDGNLLVLYGPHIGISQDGALGKLERDGMSQRSSACGALVGLLAKATDNPDYAPSYSALDPEQHLVEKGLEPYLRESLQSESPLKELTLQMYKIIHEQLGQIVDISDFPGQTVMLGGVIINTPRSEHDAFLPLHAKTRNYGGALGETRDWIDTLTSN